MQYHKASTQLAHINSNSNTISIDSAYGPPLALAPPAHPCSKVQGPTHSSRTLHRPFPLSSGLSNVDTCPRRSPPPRPRKRGRSGVQLYKPQLDLVRVSCVSCFRRFRVLCVWCVPSFPFCSYRTCESSDDSSCPPHNTQLCPPEQGMDLASGTLYATSRGPPKPKSAHRKAHQAAAPQPHRLVSSGRSAASIGLGALGCFRVGHGQSFACMLLLLCLPTPASTAVQSTSTARTRRRRVGRWRNSAGGDDRELASFVACLWRENSSAAAAATATAE